MCWGLHLSTLTEPTYLYDSPHSGLQDVPRANVSHSEHPWSRKVRVKIAVVTSVDKGVVQYKSLPDRHDFHASIADIMLVGLQQAADLVHIREGGLEPASAQQPCSTLKELMAAWQQSCTSQSGDLAVKAAREFADEFRDIHKDVKPAVGQVLFYAASLDSTTGDNREPPAAGGEHSTSTLSWAADSVHKVPWELQPGCLTNIARMLGLPAGGVLTPFGYIGALHMFDGHFEEAQQSAVNMRNCFGLHDVGTDKADTDPGPYVKNAFGFASSKGAAAAKLKCRPILSESPAELHGFGLVSRNCFQLATCVPVVASLCGQKLGSFLSL